MIDECKNCHGTGKVIMKSFWFSFKPMIVYCEQCDGTGDSRVDGAKARHIRELARIELEAKS